MSAAPCSREKVDVLAGIDPWNAGLTAPMVHHSVDPVMDPRPATNHLVDELAPFFSGIGRSIENPDVVVTAPGHQHLWLQSACAA